MSASNEARIRTTLMNSLCTSMWRWWRTGVFVAAKAKNTNGPQMPKQFQKCDAVSIGSFLIDSGISSKLVRNLKVMWIPKSGPKWNCGICPQIGHHQRGALWCERTNAETPIIPISAPSSFLPLAENMEKDQTSPGFSFGTKNRNVNQFDSVFTN